MTKADNRLILAAREALAIARGEVEPARGYGGWWKAYAVWTTYEVDECGSNTYYFAPLSRRKPPYRQIKVEATIDVAEDGTVAGIKFTVDNPPPFKPK